jgi:putative endonuclease
LVEHGYTVLARNLRTRFGELDLLVRRGNHVAAVEVKARADHPAPERLVDAERLGRMERSLCALARRLRPRPRTLSLDVVAVRWLDPLPPEVRHFATVRRVAAPGHASRSGKAPFEVEAWGYPWPMEACITLRCAEIARRFARWLGTLFSSISTPNSPHPPKRPRSASRPRCRLWPNR